MSIKTINRIVARAEVKEKKRASIMKQMLKVREGYGKLDDRLAKLVDKWNKV